MALAAVPVLVWAPSAAMAEPVNKKVKAACTGDYKRLCPAYKVGSNQLRACMEAKQSEISSRCIDALIDSGEVDRNRVGRR
jgi:hypothetical protein